MENFDFDRDNVDDLLEILQFVNKFYQKIANILIYQ